MPQLDTAMFTDQIYFMSIIFYITHIYNNEVVLPNTSAAKQYRVIKLNMFNSKIKNLSFFIFSSTKVRQSRLKFDFFKINKELLQFNNVLFYTLSYKYKYFVSSCEDLLALNFFVIQKTLTKPVTKKISSNTFLSY